MFQGFGEIQVGCLSEVAPSYFTTNTLGSPTLDTSARELHRSMLLLAKATSRDMI